MSSKYCPECGTKSVATSSPAKFCSNCGHSFVGLKSAASVVQSKEDNVESPPSFRGLTKLEYTIEHDVNKVTAADVIAMGPTNEPPRMDKKKMKGFKLPTREEALAESMRLCGSSRSNPTPIEE